MLNMLTNWGGAGTFPNSNASPINLKFDDQQTNSTFEEEEGSSTRKNTIHSAMNFHQQMK